MSGIGSNPSFKRAPSYSEDLSDIPATRRAKTHGDLINELENEYSVLEEGQKNYHLLSRIEHLYEEVNKSKQEGGTLWRLFSWFVSFGSRTDAEKINNLFNRALNRHGLSKEDGATLCNIKNLEALARQGDLEGLEFILSKSSTLDQFELAKAAASAAQSGQLDCVKYLFSKGVTIDQRYLTTLAFTAIRNRHFELLKFLLSEGRDLDQEGLENAASLAAENGHLECLRFLLSEGRDLDQDMFGDVASLAAENGQLECLQFLLTEGRALDQEGLEEAAASAAGGCYAQCLEFLLTQGILSQEKRESIILDCASKGFLNCIELILTQGPIQRSVRDDAIQALREIGSPISNILRDAPVTEELVKVASVEDLEVVSIEHVASNPLSYLDKVIENGFPKRILLAGKSAIDLGGVTKEFIFTLFSSLASMLDLDRLSFPIPQDESKKELFKKLGALLSILSARNRQRIDKLLIGTLFNGKFYQILKLALEKGKGNELNLLVAQILSGLDESYKLTAQVILDPQNEALKQEFSNALICEIEEVDQEVKKIIESYSNAALWILEGTDEPFKTLIRSSSFEDLCLMVQGKEATADEIKGAIKLGGECSDLLEQQKAWLFQILDESDTAWRKKFLTYITGRDVLPPYRKPIRLQTTMVNYPMNLKRFAFEAHTCLNSLDLPNYRFTSKEDFLAGLNDAMAKIEYTID